MSINGDVSGSEDKGSESFNFSSADIAKREKIEYFTNVKGADKLKRQNARKEKREDRKRQRAFRKDATKSESARKKNERSEEAKRLKETKRTRREYRLEKLRKSIWNKRKVIAGTTGVIALAVIAIIVTPIIINAIDRANKERIIAEGETGLIKIFRAVVDNTYTKESLEKTVKEISSDAFIDFHNDDGEIYNGYDNGLISFKNSEDASIVHSFTFKENINGEEVMIMKDNHDSYRYYREGSMLEYANLNEAVEKYIMDDYENDKE